MKMSAHLRWSYQCDVAEYLSLEIVSHEKITTATSICIHGTHNILDSYLPYEINGHRLVGFLQVTLSARFQLNLVTNLIYLSKICFWKVLIKDSSYFLWLINLFLFKWEKQRDILVVILVIFGNSIEPVRTKANKYCRRSNVTSKMLIDGFFY